MTVVLDASALLVFLHDERGPSKIDDLLDESLMSSVNWSEVVQKALARGVPTDGLRADLEALGLESSLPVYTADRVWTKLRLGLEVRVVR